MLPRVRFHCIFNKSELPGAADEEILSLKICLHHLNCHHVVNYTSLAAESRINPDYYCQHTLTGMKGNSQSWHLIHALKNGYIIISLCCSVFLIRGGQVNRGGPKHPNWL